MNYRSCYFLAVVLALAVVLVAVVLLRLRQQVFDAHLLVVLAVVLVAL